MKTFMKALRNNRKLLVAVIIAILVQVFTFACMDSTHRYFASDIATQICKLIALLLVTSSFIFNINKKSKPAIACAVASAFLMIIGYLLSCYLVYLNYRDTLVWRYSFDWSYLLEILLNILPQVMLLVFLLKKPKNVQLCAWVAVFLSFLPSLINLLLDWEYWWYTLHQFYESIILALCYDISLALLYYFGYTSTDTTQQAGAFKKIKSHLSDFCGVNKMYSNIGGKIKVLAKIVCLLGIIVSLVYGIYFFATFYWMRGMGIVIILVGPLLSWVSSFFAYGFGELIEKTTAIAEQTTKADVKKDVVE